MKKILKIIFFGSFFISNAYGTQATCTGGECEFYLSTHYESAKTRCNQTLFNEQVITNLTSFTIIETEEQCEVWEAK
jgi:hypothetical protein